MFPAAVPAAVEVTTGKGRFTRRVVAPRGEPTNPLSWNDLTAKFQTLAAKSMTPSAARGLIDAVAGLESGNIGPLLSGLHHAGKPIRPGRVAVLQAGA
jgi:2-methylcitrate dehydratase PrpD